METEAKPFISFEETLRQRQRELLTFQRDVVAPLREAALERVSRARPALFDSSFVPMKMVQAVADAQAHLRAAVQSMDAARVEAALAALEDAHQQMFDRFHVEQERRRCPVCHSAYRCPHDEPASGGEVEALYPGPVQRLQRPEQ